MFESPNQVGLVGKNNLHSLKYEGNCGSKGDNIRDRGGSIEVLFLFGNFGGKIKWVPEVLATDSSCMLVLEIDGIERSKVYLFFKVHGLMGM